MKKWLNKEKIFLIIIILILLSGVITLYVAGFEKTTEYKAGTRIEIYIPNGYEKQDIINIAKESFSKKVSFEEIEKLNQVAAIKLQDYTEEELENFKVKIAEKYGIEKDNLELQEIPLPTTRISTDITPYIFPTVLITVLSLIYILFRNLKSENKWKLILNIILTLAVVLGLYFSLILILRIPFGSYTMPLALAIYMTTLMMLVNKKKVA